MLQQFTEWLLGLIHGLFEAVWTFVVDAFINIVDLLLGVVVALAGSIPVPEFMAAGLGSLFGNLDPGILWIVTAIGIPQALAFFGVAYLFRLARKVATLFQW